MKQEKEDLLIGYITQQIALLPAMSKQYTQGKLSRISFLQLKSIATKFIQGVPTERVIIMPGLRGVGKTTLLFQTYEEIKGQLDENNLLYISCDALTKQFNSSLIETIEVYEKKILSCPFEKLEHKIILLIDEAHYDPNWQTVVKTLFDRTKNVLIIVSGSCSIAMETNTDLARRVHMEKIYPLNFAEYLLLKKGIFPVAGAMKNLRDAIFSTKNIEQAFNLINSVHGELVKKMYTKVSSMELELSNFLVYGGFPSVFELKKEEEVFRKIISVLEKVIYQDIPCFYGSCKNLVNRIFPMLHLIASSSDVISYNKFNEVINSEGGSKSVIYDLLQALTKAGVTDSMTISGAPSKKERNSLKFYFATPSIRASLLWTMGKFKRESDIMGLLLENASFNTLQKIKAFQPNLIQDISYSDKSENPDFKLITQNGEMLIECGWGSKGSRQVDKENRENFAIVICNVASPAIDKDRNILYIPREVFLLMG
jgi:uncharacterized protein